MLQLECHPQRSRQGIRHTDEGMPLQQQRQHQIGEPIAVRHTDHGHIRECFLELHRGADVRCVGGKLFSAKHDTARLPRAARGELQMRDAVRQPRDSRHLGRFALDGAEHGAIAPGSQGLRDEVGDSLAHRNQMQGPARQRRLRINQGLQLPERVAQPRGRIVQRHGVATARQRLLPGLVKHPCL